MPLTLSQIVRLSQNIILRPEVIEKIIQLWDTFPPEKQTQLLEFLGLAEDAHTFLWQHAVQLNSEFPKDINTFVAHRLHDAIAMEEAESRTEEEQKLLMEFETLEEEPAGSDSIVASN